MLAPATMFIEIAVDTFKDLPNWLRQAQQKELSGFGDVRAQALGATGLSMDFRTGYELGLQVARTILAGSPALALKGVNPQDVL